MDRRALLLLPSPPPSPVFHASPASSAAAAENAHAPPHDDPTDEGDERRAARVRRWLASQCRMSILLAADAAADDPYTPSPDAAPLDWAQHEVDDRADSPLLGFASRESLLADPLLENQPTADALRRPARDFVRALPRRESEPAARDKVHSLLLSFPPRR